MSARQPRSSRRSLLLAGVVAVTVVIPGSLLFTAVSQAATLPPAVVTAASVPAAGAGPLAAPMTSPPTPSPAGCPTTGTPGFTPRPSGDPEPPTPPCRLAAAVSGTSVVLSWGASSDNVGVTGYIVHDLANGVVTQTPVTGQAITVTQDPAEQHVYWVVARDAIGNRSGPSNQVTVGGGTADTERPSAPTNLTVTLSGSQATLTWTASTDNVGVTEYIVNDMNSDVVYLIRVPGGTTTLTYTIVRPTIQHRWWVNAVDAAGNRSLSSNTVTLGTPDPCQPPGQPPGCLSPRTTTPTASRTTMMSMPPIHCRVSYTIVSQWQGGFQAKVTVTNTGTTPLSAWTLDFTFPDGQTIDHLWGGVRSGDGPTVSVGNAAWNGSVPAGGSAWFGFNGKWSGANGAPASFRLNNGYCVTA